MNLPHNQNCNGVSWQQASKKGASAWLTTLPIEEHGFALHKGAFRDALALRYGWPIRFSAEKCLCGAKFKPDHQMICRQGGYVSLRHNELRDLTASLIKKVCSDVSTESMLQQVSGETPSPVGKQRRFSQA